MPRPPNHFGAYATFLGNFLLNPIQLRKAVVAFCWMMLSCLYVNDVAGRLFVSAGQ